MHIDQNLGWRAAAERAERADSPRRRRMLEVLAGHMRTEMESDLPGMLADLAPEPAYHLWAAGRDSGPKGRPAIERYYTDLLAARRGVLEYAIERFVIDDDTVVTEGVIRAYQPGRAAHAFGFDVPDLDATYLVSYRALILWPFDEEVRMLGEDGYATWDPSDFVRVRSEDLPPAYTSQFTAQEYASVGITTA